MRLCRSRLRTSDEGGVMRTAQRRVILKFILFSLSATSALLTGCVDFGHKGAYKLVLNVSSTPTSTTAITGQSQKQLEIIARQTLLASGFREATGRRTIWLKHGTTVMLDCSSDDTLLLKLTSMGSASRVRAEKEIETELVQALRTHPEVTVTPATPPNP